VAKLVDAGDSKSPAARCVGSSPTLGTMENKPRFAVIFLPVIFVCILFPFTHSIPCIICNFILKCNHQIKPLPIHTCNPIAKAFHNPITDEFAALIPHPNKKSLYTYSRMPEFIFNALRHAHDAPFSSPLHKPLFLLSLLKNPHLFLIFLQKPVDTVIYAL
jgi:hypothetical protein